ncbi:hypothetical protein Tco_0424775, partial [Tanacetum coccineum]
WWVGRGDEDEGDGVQLEDGSGGVEWPTEGPGAAASKPHRKKREEKEYEMEASDI